MSKRLVSFLLAFIMIVGSFTPVLGTEIIINNNNVSNSNEIQEPINHVNEETEPKDSKDDIKSTIIMGEDNNPSVKSGLDSNIVIKDDNKINDKNDGTFKADFFIHEHGDYLFRRPIENNTLRYDKAFSNNRLETKYSFSIVSSSLDKDYDIGDIQVVFYPLGKNNELFYIGERHSSGYSTYIDLFNSYDYNNSFFKAYEDSTNSRIIFSNKKKCNAGSAISVFSSFFTYFSPYVNTLFEKNNGLKPTFELIDKQTGEILASKTMSIEYDEFVGKHSVVQSSQKYIDSSKIENDKLVDTYKIALAKKTYDGYQPENNTNVVFLKSPIKIKQWPKELKIKSIKYSWIDDSGKKVSKDIPFSLDQNNSELVFGEPDKILTPKEIVKNKNTKKSFFGNKELDIEYEVDKSLADKVFPLTVEYKEQSVYEEQERTVVLNGDKAFVKTPKIYTPTPWTPPTPPPEPKKTTEKIYLRDANGYGGAELLPEEMYIYSPDKKIHIKNSTNSNFRGSFKDKKIRFEQYLYPIVVNKNKNNSVIGRYVGKFKDGEVKRYIKDGKTYDFTDTKVYGDADFDSNGSYEYILSSSAQRYMRGIYKIYYKTNIDDDWKIIPHDCYVESKNKNDSSGTYLDIRKLNARYLKVSEEFNKEKDIDPTDIDAIYRLDCSFIKDDDPKKYSWAGLSGAAAFDADTNEPIQIYKTNMKDTINGYIDIKDVNNNQFKSAIKTTPNNYSYHNYSGSDSSYISFGYNVLIDNSLINTLQKVSESKNNAVAISGSEATFFPSMALTPTPSNGISNPYYGYDSKKDMFRACSAINIASFGKWSFANEISGGNYVDYYLKDGIQLEFDRYNKYNEKNTKIAQLGNGTTKITLEINDKSLPEEKRYDALVRSLANINLPTSKLSDKEVENIRYNSNSYFEERLYFLMDKYFLIGNEYDLINGYGRDFYAVAIGRNELNNNKYRLSNKDLSEWYINLLGNEYAEGHNHERSAYAGLKYLFDENARYKGEDRYDFLHDLKNNYPTYRKELYWIMGKDYAQKERNFYINSENPLLREEGKRGVFWPNGESAIENESMIIGSPQTIWYSAKKYTPNYEQRVYHTVRTKNTNDLFLSDTQSTPLGAEYTYRLGLETAGNDMTNIIMYYSIENASPKFLNWKGTLENIDVSSFEKLGAKVNIYYSTVKNPGSLDSDNKNWQAYNSGVDKSQIKELAFKFMSNDESDKPWIMKSKTNANILIQMVAPDKNEKQALAYSEVSCEWKPADGQNVENITSNRLRLSLPGSIIDDRLAEFNNEFILSKDPADTTATVFIEKIDSQGNVESILPFTKRRINHIPDGKYRITCNKNTTAIEIKSDTNEINVNNNIITIPDNIYKDTRTEIYIKFDNSSQDNNPGYKDEDSKENLFKMTVTNKNKKIIHIH